MIFVDSNIWCYYFDQRLPEHKKVREPMREIINSEEIICNTIIVMEVAHYIVRNFTKEEAQKKIDLFVNLKNMEIIDFDHPTMMETIETLIEYAYVEGLDGRDATILATMNSQNVNKIFSHDNTLKHIASKLALQVIDPI